MQGVQVQVGIVIWHCLYKVREGSQRLLGPQASLPRYAVIAELFDLSFPPLSGVANGLDKKTSLIGG